MVNAGIQQALAYAETLDIPFVFSSNGDAFLLHDKTVTSGDFIETEVQLTAFPSPDQLWQKYKTFKGINDDVAAIVSQDYFFDGSNRSPRYYQQIAINRTVEAIARNEGNNRHLLVMATGTGKTYTAFQIMLGRVRLWAWLGGVLIATSITIAGLAQKVVPIAAYGVAAVILVGIALACLVLLA
jgi:type I restriction enzyme R subunit